MQAAASSEIEDTEELELTPEQEEKANQIANDWVKMSVLANELDQGKVDQLIEASTKEEETSVVIVRKNLIILIKD
ncbi:hypothetical protein ACE1TI_00120 [Alteribacillus sp. JSM 102045]|uniref:hypothetical protein n=1 Tax=Alteribacillus sp. JSM 102045 TaxID=1562101 RepID=UPI0035C1F55E